MGPTKICAHHVMLHFPSQLVRAQASEVDTWSPAAKNENPQSFGRWCPWHSEPVVGGGGVPRPGLRPQAMLQTSQPGPAFSRDSAPPQHHNPFFLFPQSSPPLCDRRSPASGLRSKIDSKNVPPPVFPGHVEGGRLKWEKGPGVIHGRRTKVVLWSLWIAARRGPSLPRTPHWSRRPATKTALS